MSAQQDDLAKTLIALSGNESVITVRKPFVQFTGSLEAGMMLSQLLYWTPRARIPGGWIAKSDREFNDELCLSSYAIRKARKELEKLGILETALKKFAGAPTTHYRLKMAELRQAWATFISQMDLSNSQNPIVEIKESSTETTTETTTKETPTADAGAPTPKSPPDDPVKEEYKTPVNLDGWLDELRGTNNRVAVLRRMLVTLFPGEEPAYSYVGKIAKQVGGAGRCATLLWQAAGQRITGDPLRYISVMKKNGENENGQQPKALADYGPDDEIQPGVTRAMVEAAKKKWDRSPARSP
jgi:hypothetical protein